MNAGDTMRGPRVHFCGIGGTAMVSGAALAIEAGWEVRGSDNPLYPPTSELVKALGVPVADQYDAANLDWAPDVVVIGNALSRGNPEVEAVLERRLCYVSLPEWLKEHVLRRRRPVAVCGTHGKTTTSALTAHLLREGGIDAGYLVGGQALGFAKPALLGAEHAPFVIEGDEYDTAFFDKRAKFLHYLPEIAVVTSIEFDHGDIYGDIDEIEVAFQRMLRQIPQSGHLLLCADDPRAAALRQHAYCSVVTCGFSDDADWRIEAGPAGPDGQAFALHHHGEPWGELTSPMFGRHNLQNATAAVAVAALCGLSRDDTQQALPRFDGVRRRMEVFLEAAGITFVDDFAHHPSAIRETIAAARTRWPGRRLRVAFEPRSNTTVTNRFQDPLCEVLSGADEVWLGPIYRPERVPPDERLDRQALAEVLAARGQPAHVGDTAAAIVQGLQESVVSGDVVLILSNGAFDGIYDRIRTVFSAESQP